MWKMKTWMMLNAQSSFGWNLWRKDEPSSNDASNKEDIKISDQELGILEITGQTNENTDASHINVS